MLLGTCVAAYGAFLAGWLPPSAGRGHVQSVGVSVIGRAHSDAALLMLAGPGSSYLTGQLITVDGGVLAGGSWEE